MALSLNNNDLLASPDIVKERLVAGASLLSSTWQLYTCKAPVFTLELHLTEMLLGAPNVIINIINTINKNLPPIKVL